MEISIRPVPPEEAASYLGVLEVAAGRMPTADSVAEELDSQAPCQRLGAFDGGRLVAGTGFDLLDLTLPGLQTARVARIMLTAALPTHRGRGLVRRLMTRQVGDIREQGLPLAIFTTSGPGIYHRFGYNPASTAMSVSVDPWSALMTPPTGDCSVRLVDLDEARGSVPEVFDAHRRVQPAQVSRSDSFWRSWFLDRPLYRIEGAGERFIALAEDAAGVPTGYLSYRLVRGELREDPVRELVVEDLVASTDAARHALWFFCVSFRQGTRVTAPNVPVDEPLPWLLDDPRSMKVTRVRDFLWLRLVDPPAALVARRYATNDSLVISVSDQLVPANCGTIRIDGGPDGAQCTPVASAPNLRIDIGSLGACYLGASTFTSLARAGRLEVTDETTLHRADAMFACRPSPWTVTDW